MPERLPSYTVNELERKATEFLRATWPQGIRIPVDVDFLMEKQEDTDFDYWPKLEANYGIVGAACRDLDTGRLLVYVDEDLANSDHRRNLYRMTVAEELAHVVLHGDVIRAVTSIDDFRQLQQHETWYQAERNAKRFAAAVLMPPEQLLRESNRIYRELVRVAGYANGEAIKKYLCTQAAQLFEVSPKTMSIRLGEWPMRIDDRVDAAIDARLETLL
jgi:hypothetical protein